MTLRRFNTKFQSRKTDISASFSDFNITLRLNKVLRSNNLSGKSFENSRQVDAVF